MGNHVIEGVKGLTAAGSITAPTPMYGNYLTTHGLELLSYAECMQVLGSVYVAYLLIKGLSNSSIGRRIRERIKNWFD